MPVLSLLLGDLRFAPYACMVWRRNVGLRLPSAWHTGGDRKDAMLYSISVMTTVGGTNLHLDPGWQLMGSLEALDGWILFGLTAAFLFVVIQKVWSLERV